MTYVHRQRDAHNNSIEVEKRLVLVETTRDQLSPDQVKEVSIESTINNEIENFFNSIPYIVNMDKGGGNIHASRDPNDKHRDINEAYKAK
jgi:hypothetical protein